MPRSLCAAKRQIKESVIRSAASAAADSRIAATEAVNESGEGQRSNGECVAGGMDGRTKLRSTP